MDCNKHINKSIKTGNSVQNSSSIIKSKIFKHHMTRVGGPLGKDRVTVRGVGDSKIYYKSLFMK